MTKLIWSASALRDIQRLYRFLADKNRNAANSAVQSIRQSMKILAQQPEIGRPADEMGPRFREWLINFGQSGYIAIYHYDGTTAVILAVRHQREAGY